MKEPDICSYWTFKAKENPDVYFVRDGCKGWCKDTVNPTVHKAGWKDCIQEYGYRLFDNEKPKEMAVRQILKQVVNDANTLIDVSTTAHKTKIDADKYIPHIIGLLLKGDEK